MNILLVDDEPDIRGVVTQFLTLSGRHDVVATASAQAALEEISTVQAPFDCVLVDIQMPEVDGIALVQMIRATPGYRNTPIIMLSALGDKAHLDRAFFCGATDYVTKPVDFHELAQRLGDVQKLAADKLRASAAMPGEGDFRTMGGEPKDFTLATPVPLKDVAGAIDYGEFENYVRQILRRQLFKLTAYAVKIERVDRLFAAATSQAFAALLSDTGSAISSALLGEDGALCYRGNGIFLCVTAARPKGRRAALEVTLNQRLQAILTPTGQIAPRLALGDSLALPNRSERRALEALARAVENVETQAVDDTDMFEVHGRLMKQQRFNAEQRRLEQRAFESLLRDNMAPAPDDVWARKLFRRAQRRSEA